MHKSSDCLIYEGTAHYRHWSECIFREFVAFREGGMEGGREGGMVGREGRRKCIMEC